MVWTRPANKAADSHLDCPQHPTDRLRSVPSVKDALDGRRAHTFELGTGGSAIQ
ncbi:hypothetical protein PCANC_20299 [Puccinia coronata f. sp. avenae]|uniref:Uncharacterized protein n=1 Tax=Puccinia coronata f. sp. avenae TaxID=200324 RepID=A0A2N5UMX6_9BASI|nr:hypothetical protein PCANC_20299 [Puccinia coronata f. sp. avenae]